MNKGLILVVGASGTVGSEIVRLLKADGARVRTTTSRKPQAGTEQVHLNLATGEGLSAAFEGVDRAFFLSPPGYADQYALLSPLVKEAQRRGLKKVVLMTAMGVNASDSIPFRRVELDLEKSGLNYNIIRPNWFMQNFNTFWVRGIREQGQIRLPAGNAKTSFIDARDISGVAAKLLVSDEFARQDFDLTGPKAVDHAEVAAAISKRIGKTITYQDVDPSELKTGLLAAGLPADYVEFMLVIMGYLREGYSARVTDNVQKILGRAPIPLEQYVADHRQAWE